MPTLQLSITCFIFALLPSISYASNELASPPVQIKKAQWHEVYLDKLDTDKNSALNMLQDRYSSLEASGEKLYISSLLYSFMTNNQQPYFGGDSLDAQFNALEEQFINALANDGRGNYNAAQQAYLSILERMQTTQDLDGKILTEYQLCRSLNEQAQYHKANYYCSSLENHIKAADDPAMPRYLAYRVIANNHYFRGNYHLALNSYQELLQQFPSGRDVSGIYNDIGNLLRDLKQYQQSGEYLTEALKLRQTSSKLEQAQVHHSLASLYIVQNYIDKAIHHYKVAFQLLTDVSHEYGLGMTNLGLGKAYTALGDYDIAHGYLVTALSSAASFGHDGIRIESYLALSDMFEDQELINEAFHYANLAKSLSEKVQRTKYLSRTLIQLTDLSNLNHDYQSAYQYYKQYAEAELATRDSNNRLAYEALELTKAQYEKELSNSNLLNKSRLDRMQIEQMENQRLMYNLVVILLLCIASLSFISNRKTKLKSQLDLMTQCLNRATAIQKIKQTPAINEHEHKHVLILLDLDNFKLINDEHGHPTGDRALVHISQRIRDLLNDNEFIGRLGGEEFIILLTDVEEQDISLRVAHLHQTIANSRFVSEAHTSLNVTASFSYLATSRSLRDFDELYSILDQALYQAKKNGRNCIIDAYNEAIDLPTSAYSQETA